MQSNTLLIGGAAVVAVVIGAAVIWRPVPDPAGMSQDQAQEVGEQDSGAQTGATAAPESTGVAGDAAIEDRGAGAATAVVATGDAAVADIPNDVNTPNDTDAPAQLLLTQFRFEPDGAFLVSGTTTPHHSVVAFVDGAEVERATAAPDGSFFLSGFAGYSDAPRSLTVISDPDGAGIAADRRFVMAANPAPVIAAVDVGAADEAPRPDTARADPPPEQVMAPLDMYETTPLTDAEQDGVPSEEGQQADGQNQEMAQNATDASTQNSAAPALENLSANAQLAAETPEDVSDEGAAAQILPDPQEPAASTPATPAILAVTSQGIDVVQAPVASGTPPDAMSNVALDTITYNPSGDVVLGGRAVGAGFVQVYVDNAPISRLPIDADGTWRGGVPDIDTGVYILRIDEIDAEGEVVSRIETPFLRESTENVIEAMAQDVDNPDFTVETRTVQPGATLWAIAEQQYGAGTLYVNVFEANRDRIRNPDLIYPGQVFLLPDNRN